MTSFKHFFVTFLLAGCFIYPMAGQADNHAPSCSYMQKVGSKTGLAFANMTTGILEVPKSIAKTSNDSNIFFGLTGGLLKGFFNGVGRLSVGTFDLATAWLPTKPIANPLYVWDDYKMDTSYNDLLAFDNCEAVDVESDSMEVPAVASPAVVVAPRLPPVQAATPQQTNQKIDTIFRKQMMK